MAKRKAEMAGTTQRNPTENVNFHEKEIIKYLLVSHLAHTFLSAATIPLNQESYLKNSKGIFARGSSLLLEWLLLLLLLLAV